MITKKPLQQGLLFVFLMVLFLGCQTSENSSSSSSDDGGSTTDPTPTVEEAKVQFTINAQNILATDDSTSTEENETIKSAVVSIQNESGTLFHSETSTDSFELSRNVDGSLRISGKTSQNKLTAGDIVTLQAQGYIPQQFVIDPAMLEAGGTNVKIKEVDSIQSFLLGDLINGQVTSKSQVGASSKISNGLVHFQNGQGNLTLSLPVKQFTQMAKSIQEKFQANQLQGDDELIYLEMTTIDPKTEGESAIGDYSFDPNFEVSSSSTFSTQNQKTRSIQTREESILESVVMANIKMKTESGQEIHCFGDGTYNEETQECSDGQTATLRMKIPAAQFNQYAEKYNVGERRVPLYSYNEKTASWVRQTRLENGVRVEVDGELILEDNNQSQKADQGDLLFLEGQVGHFSYWNGDVPIQRTCLKGTITRGDELLPSGTQVIVEGVDYSGRIFKQLLTSDALSFDRIYAKKNAKAKIYLLYPNGVASEAIYIQTGEIASNAETCQSTINLEEGAASIELVSTLSVISKKIKVVDLSNTPLPGAILSSNFQTITATSTDATAELTIAKEGTTDISVSYQTDAFVAKTQISLSASSPETTTVSLDTTVFELSGTITTDDTAAQGSVRAVAGESREYQALDEFGKYKIQFQSSAIQIGEKVKIRIYAYSAQYAKYLSEKMEITITSEHIDAKKIEVPSVNFQFSPFHVSGKITDPFAEGGNQGVSGVRVWSSGAGYTTTDEDGFYQLQFFVNSKEDQKIYAYDPQTRKKATPEVITLLAGTSTDQKDQNFTVVRTPATLQGTVVNQKGIPVEGVRVYWSNRWISTTTDASGDFKLEALQAGTGKVYLYGAESWKLLGPPIEKDTEGNTLEMKLGEVLDLETIQVSNNIAPLILGIQYSPKSPVKGEVFVVRVDALDPDQDALTYSYTSSTGETIDATGDTAEITAGNPGWMKLTITVSDGLVSEGYAETKKTQWIYIQNNSKPQIQKVEATQNGLPIGEYFNPNLGSMLVKITAYDPEGSQLSYSGVLFNVFGEEVQGYTTSSGSSVTILDTLPNGSYQLKITVSDGVNTARAKLRFQADNNTPPTIQTIYVNQDVSNDIGKTASFQSQTGGQATLTVLAQDDQAGLSYQWFLPNTLSPQNTTQATVSFDLSKAGSYSGGILVKDAGGFVATRKFNLEIQSNLKPVLQQVTWSQNKIMLNGEVYRDSAGNSLTEISLSVSAVDPEGQSLSYQFTEIDSPIEKQNGATSTATYSLPTGDQKLSLGRHAVKITVSDGNQQVTGYAIFEVAINRPPKLTSFFVPLQMKQFGEVELVATASDVDQDPLTFTWSIEGDSLGATIQVNSSTDQPSIATLSTSQVQNAGNIQIKLLVSDGNNPALVRERVVKIVENQAPVIQSVQLFPNLVGDGETIHLRSRAYDVDSSSISYNWYIRDASADVGTGRVVNTQQEFSATIGRGESEIQVEQLGHYLLWLQVSDGEKTTTSSTLALEIVESSNQVPTQPTITVGKSLLVQGESTNIQASASDPDGEALRFEWTLNGTKLNTTRDRITFQEDVTGDYQVKVRAFDGKSYSPESSTVIEVRSVVLQITASPSRQLPLGSEFTLTAAFSDGKSASADTVWSVLSKPEGSTVTTTTKGASIQITPDKTGSYRLKAETRLFDISYEGTLTVGVGADLSTIDGTIRDENLQPLPGVILRLYHQTDLNIYDQTTQTDENGLYQFDFVPTGKYYLVVYADGYVQQTHVIVVGGTS